MAKPEWVLDKAARHRIDAALQAIDDAHAGLPECAVCGQHANRLDQWGACTKTTDLHREHRAGR